MNLFAKALSNGPRKGDLEHQGASLHSSVGIIMGRVVSRLVLTPCSLNACSSGLDRIYQAATHPAKNSKNSLALLGANVMKAKVIVNQVTFSRSDPEVVKVVSDMLSVIFRKTPTAIRTQKSQS